MFKSGDHNTKVIFLGSLPVVYVTPWAMQKMWEYVKQSADEIGWLGTVTRNDSGTTYLVEDVFLFEQEVHSATCEITSDGLLEFANELLQKENGEEIYNKLRLWGHSHVNMGVSPSGQDNEQMTVFKEGGAEFFLRVICNKQGDMEFTIYDYKRDFVIEDAEWNVYMPVYKGIAEEIAEEIKNKVKKKSYISDYRVKSAIESYNKHSFYDYYDYKTPEEEDDDNDEHNDSIPPHIKQEVHAIINRYGFDAEDLYAIALLGHKEGIKYAMEILNDTGHEITFEEASHIYGICVEGIDYIEQLNDIGIHNKGVI